MASSKTILYGSTPAQNTRLKHHSASASMNIGKHVGNENGFKSSKRYKGITQQRREELCRRWQTDNNRCKRAFSFKQRSFWEEEGKEQWQSADQTEETWTNSDNEKQLDDYHRSVSQVSLIQEDAESSVMQQFKNEQRQQITDSVKKVMSEDTNMSETSNVYEHEHAKSSHTNSQVRSDDSTNAIRTATCNKPDKRKSSK